MKYYAREMERYCFKCLKSGQSPKSILATLQKEYEVDKERAEVFLSNAIREVKKGTTELPPLKVISNTELNIRDSTGKNIVTKFDTDYFIAHVLDHEMEDCILLLDEAYLYIDSRSGQSKMNKLFSYFIAQTRKRGVEMFVCVQHIDLVDKRLRRAVDERATCKYLKEAPCSRCGGLGFVTQRQKGGTMGPEEKCPRCLGYCETGYAISTIWNKRTGERKRLKIFGPGVFWLFDTKELLRVQGKDMKIEQEDL
jgi:predicted peroxiredoxin